MVDFLKFLSSPAIATPAGAISNGAVIGTAAVLGVAGTVGVIGAAKSISNQRITIENFENKPAPTDLERAANFVKKHKKGLSTVGLIGALAAIVAGTLLTPKENGITLSYPPLLDEWYSVTGNIVATPTFGHDVTSPLVSPFTPTPPIPPATTQPPPSSNGGGGGSGGATPVL